MSRLLGMMKVHASIPSESRVFPHPSTFPFFPSLLHLPSSLIFIYDALRTPIGIGTFSRLENPSLGLERTQDPLKAMVKQPINPNSIISRKRISIKAGKPVPKKHFDVSPGTPRMMQRRLLVLPPSKTLTGTLLSIIKLSSLLTPQPLILTLEEANGDLMKVSLLQLQGDLVKAMALLQEIRGSGDSLPLPDRLGFNGL